MPGDSKDRVVRVMEQAGIGLLTDEDFGRSIQKAFQSIVQHRFNRERGLKRSCTTRLSSFRFYAGKPSFTFTNSRAYKPEGAFESAPATPATAYSVRL
jgi:hypothetical protein